MWQPPTLDFPETAPRPTVPKDMITQLRVAGVQVVLEKAGLSGVQKRLGGTIGHSGDGGEALKWLCYSGADTTGRWVLWLESSEIAGGAIDGFALRRLDQMAEVDRRCHALPESEAGIELPVALRLGMTEMQVRNTLGAPTTTFRSTLIFEHEHQRSIRNKPYTVTNTVALALRGGVVFAIQVWRDTSS